MTTIIGQGNFKYQVAEGWGKLPAGWKFGDVAAVGGGCKGASGQEALARAGTAPVNGLMLALLQRGLL